MKIREAIKKLLKLNSNVIFCNNGVEITLLDIGLKTYDRISYVKNIDGKDVYRRILCRINVIDENTVRHLRYKNGKINSAIWMFDPDEDYNYFDENDFYLSEREMNIFINDNYGIDEYRTFSVPYYMMADTMMIMDMMEME